MTLAGKTGAFAPMPFWILSLIVAATWLTYPIAGAIGVAASVAKGTSPEDAGFSFLPELIVFPALSIGAALSLDYFVAPMGSVLVGGFTAIMFVWMIVDSFLNVLTIRRQNNQHID